MVGEPQCRVGAYRPLGNTYKGAGSMAASRSIAGPNVDSSQPAGSSPIAPVTRVDTPIFANASAPRTTSSTVASARDVAVHRGDFDLVGVAAHARRSGGAGRRACARPRRAAEDVARVGVLGDQAEGLPLAAAADDDPRARRADRHRAAERLFELVVPAVGTRRCRRSTSAGRSGSPPRAARSAPATGGNGTPRPRCSRSYHAAPMPSSARPPDTTSSVVTVLARSPGWRYVTPVTRRRSRSALGAARRRSRARCSPRASGPRPVPSSPSGRSGP